MHRRKLTLISLLTIFSPIVLHGAKDDKKDNEEKKWSEHAAKILLKTKNIDPKSAEGEKMSPILAWMCRGENYQKPCKYPKLENQRKRIITVRQLYEKWQSCTTQMGGADCRAFDKYVNEADGQELLLAIQIYQKLKDAKIFVRRIVHQLYNNVFSGGQALDPLIDQLRRCPTTIADVKGIEKGVNKEYPVLNYLFNTATLLLNKKNSAPFIWSGTKPKRVTVGHFTLTTDPANKRVELTSSGKILVSMECEKPSQMVCLDAGIIACAATLYPNKTASRADLQGMLILNTQLQHHIVIEHPYPTQFKEHGPIIPEVIYQGGVIVVNWHDSVDIFYPTTNTVITQASTNWIDSVHLTYKNKDSGNMMLLSRELTTGKGQYMYRITKIKRINIPLVDHLKAAASENLGYLLSGVGFGKTTFDTKLVNKKLFKMQHGSDQNIETFFENINGMNGE